MRKKIAYEKIRYYMPVTVIAFVLFSFLVYGYKIGFIPNIEYPPLTLQHILSKAYNNYSHSNIRYGIILAPLLALFAGIAAAKNKILFGIVIFLFCFQLFAYFYTPLLLQFSFPRSWYYNPIDAATWFTDHYDNGLILISANRHENFMFQTGFPYKDFIYEGTREYWTITLDDPSKYAKWVIYQQFQGDKVTELLTEHAHTILSTEYTLVYNKDGYSIYERND